MESNHRRRPIVVWNCEALELSEGLKARNVKAQATVGVTARHLTKPC